MKISKGLTTLTTTQTGMAQALGVTQPRVHQLIQDGIILKNPAGNVLVIESLKNYYKQKAAIEDTEDVDLTKERALHEKAKREIAELKLAKMQGSVYDARTVELVMTEMYSNLRTQLLGLPSKLAPILEGKSKEEIYAAMTKELEEKLSELSQYSPELFLDSDVEEAGDDDEEL